jgi:hypothetical protein
MDEQMVNGDYTAMGVVNIRTQMKTSPFGNQVGGYTNGLPFRVYQVYPEVDGIVWGRVSSNTGEGKARYVALRVNNNVKAKLEKAFEDESNDPGETVRGDNALVSAIKELTAAIREVSDVRMNTK